jgi:hypothetical protein
MKIWCPFSSQIEKDRNMAMDTLTVVLAFVATLCFFTVCLVVAIKGHETVAVKII